ncbi:MAG: glucosaminidase domain-containing protein [Bacteroidales bacterium]
MKRQALLLSLLFTSFIVLEAQRKNPDYVDYVERYKDIAISNSKKYKIPASITLAQGLLESGAGKGRLAKEGNNHFGIKCHSDWSGRRIYHNDDEIGECFRRYRHADESFSDHAKFLSQRSRYAFLFDYRPTDYKAWANGLSKAGYATDKSYPSKLIRLIEDYELHKYDKGGSLSRPNREDKETVIMRESFINQGLLYVEAKRGESIDEVAKEIGISRKRLCKYNELPSGYTFEGGEIIYLEKKSKKSKGADFYHTIIGGESIYFVSQKYGITLKGLYKLNDFAGDYIPKEGDSIRIR